MIISNELAAKFARVSSPEVSEEMLGAYIEGNLSEAEAGYVRSSLELHDGLADLLDDVSELDEMTGMEEALAADDLPVWADSTDIDSDDILAVEPSDDPYVDIINTSDITVGDLSQIDITNDPLFSDPGFDDMTTQDDTVTDDFTNLV